MFVWSRSQSTNSNCLPYCGNYGEVSNQNWEVDKRYGVALVAFGNSVGRESIIVEVVWSTVSDRKPYTTTVGITNTPRPLEKYLYHK